MASAVGKEVLIVDDHAGVREALRVLLESRGYHCEEVADGAAALECLAMRDFDLVITDYQMPVMDGLQLLERLSVQAGHPRHRVILHTGALSSGVTSRALSAGACQVLAKPSPPGELLASVAQAIAEH